MVNGEYLTAAEQEALTTKGLRKRAQALNQLLGLATQLGLEETVVERGVAAVRELSPKEMKKIRKALATVSRTFGEAPIASGVHIEDLMDDAAVSSEIPTIPTPEETPEEPVSPSIEVSIETISEEVELPSVDDDEKDAHEVSVDGMFVLRRFTKEKDLSIDDLSTRDIDSILEAITAATQGNNLTEYTATKIRTLLAGVPRKNVQGAESALTNVYTSIQKSGKAAQLTASLKGVDGSIALPAVDVESKVVASTQETPIIEEVLQAETTSLTEAEIDQILGASLRRPEVVSRPEWLQAAEARLRRLAGEKSFTNEQTTELWNWIHFDENGEAKEVLSDGAKFALDKIQSIFAASPRHAQHFQELPLQNTAIRSLLMRAMGVNPLDKIYNGMVKKQSEASQPGPKITRLVAERHVVAGVLYLLEQK